MFQYTGLSIVMLFSLFFALRSPDQHDIKLNKCCPSLEMLSGDGKSCIEAPWTEKFTFNNTSYGYIEPPFDENWWKLWVPPGISTSDVTGVSYGNLYDLIDDTSFVVLKVNSSSVFKQRKLRADIKQGPAVVSQIGILRRHPEGSFRAAFYCIDAALPPLAPFALVFLPQCELFDCFRKCCPNSKALTIDNGTWVCKEDPAAEAEFQQLVTAARAIDPEIPLSAYSMSYKLSETNYKAHSLTPDSEEFKLIIKWQIREFLFSTWTEICFGHKRQDNGSLTATILYVEESNITRGVHRMLQPLSFISTLLLVAALAAIASNRNTRRTAHGWCLACHAACLLAFNLGQAVFVIENKNMDKPNKLPLENMEPCTAFGIWMYFLLMAAATWLTAVCINMVNGFGNLQGALRSRRRYRKRFLFLSLFAWGTASAMAFLVTYLLAGKVTRESVWYLPTLVETRTCYNDYIFSRLLVHEAGLWMEEIFDPNSNTLMQYGTLLFFYCPVCVLVLINIVCLFITLRKVQYLKRGNSVLRRDEDQCKRTRNRDEEETIGDVSKGRRRGDNTTGIAKTSDPDSKR